MIPVFGLFLILAFVSCKQAEVNEIIFLDHQLDFKLNIEKHSANFTDQGLMQVNTGVNMFYLASEVKIEALTIADIPVDFNTLDSSGLSGIETALATKILALEPPSDALWVLFEYGTTGKASFNIKYSGTFDADVADTKFSNQNIGREITGTILEKGAYFSPSSYYYPQGDDDLMQFEISVTIPATWESVSDGNSITSECNGKTKTQSWENPYQSDGLMFMAAPYVVKHVKADDIDVYCYFFEADTGLFETYLPATAEYVKMYSELIGPYPYKRFTVAENFFPTGYGMPAWTLLGQQVIRLPFIVMSSLGHEVLHNWWGNSIYVDYEKGNWCEGLTVYGADYRYKLKHSSASARAYRKNILKAYKNYVTAENEFPVRDFVARHNPESRIIGYDKSMMIFHMIEELIGSENFIQAWRDIYAEHKGEEVTWEQWIDAYEKASGQDLDFIIPQWVDKVGAAQISVELLETKKENGTSKIKFQVNQPEDNVYTLKIPVKFIGVKNQDTSISVSKTKTIIELTLNGEPSAFELDPDYDLFRHLYPREIEPTVGAVLGKEKKYFLYYSAKDEEPLNLFGDNLTDTDISPQWGLGLPAIEGAHATIFLNPNNLPGGLARRVKLNETYVTINRSAYPRDGHTFVFSAEDKKSAANYLIVLSEDQASLPRLGQLVPHYGKYSYLVFKGSKNIVKGQWPALTSPLRIEF